MTTLEKSQEFHCPRCGGPLIKSNTKRYNKIDLIGALVIGGFVFCLPALAIISDDNRPGRWPMGIVVLALAIGYILKRFVGYEMVEIIKCKYCGKKIPSAKL